MVDSALVIPVDLPPSLEHLRQRYDPDAAWLPAHITLLVPFAPADKRAGIAARLDQALAGVVGFTVQVPGVGVFYSPDRAVVYLRLHSPHLMRLIARVHRRFGDYPPYAGRHPVVVPHVTIGRVAPNLAAPVLKATRQALAALPALSLAVTRVEWLIPHPPGRCQRIAQYPLAQVSDQEAVPPVPDQRRKPPAVGTRWP
ncbi:MAG: 2'-5' RNA ligase family protein [Firmicutes bacterium]|nr:2'-5' RNA ligase family protein [Alicyclobacillaceae bacterium]MCL6496893.1 2'-5' RNA ligase family protein [Bacillota bacterium]